jgi:large subunit ribosomal protein L1
MRDRGKKFTEKAKLVDRTKVYSPDDALKLVKGAAFAKFDETVDLTIVLGIDLKKGGETVRGTVALPAGTGKSVRVGVIAKGDKITEAQGAGADFAGSDDLVQKISGGWLDFDVLIATPDMMGAVGRLGKLLGQKGLMPNPKSGTVTFDVAKTVKEFKGGKIEFKADKTGVLHLKSGKVSFDEAALLKNFHAIFEAINKARPASTKGTFIKSVTVSSTMGPGIKVDTKKLV